MKNKIDLEVALKKIHELATSEGDLGREYWNQISTLLKQAADMQSVIDSLSRELEFYRTQQETKGAIERYALLMKRSVDETKNI